MTINVNHLGCVSCQTLWQEGDKKVSIMDAYGNEDIVCKDCRRKTFNRFKKESGFATSIIIN